jgi:hypothetical protein
MAIAYLFSSWARPCHIRGRARFDRQPRVPNAGTQIRVHVARFDILGAEEQGFEIEVFTLRIVAPAQGSHVRHSPYAFFVRTHRVLIRGDTDSVRIVGLANAGDPNIELYDPDLWTDEYAFLNQPGQVDIQSDLFYDYRTNVEAYPKWQAWMREKQPRLQVIWGKYDFSFDLGEPERYRKNVPNADVYVLDAGHFGLDTKADEIAALVRVVKGTITST